MDDPQRAAMADAWGIVAPLVGALALGTADGVAANPGPTWWTPPFACRSGCWHRSSASRWHQLEGIEPVMAPRLLFKWLVGLLATVLLGCSVVVSAAHAADPVIAASGDIACGSNSTGAACQQAQTANVLASISPLNAVLPLGDDQYECGELSNFNTFYNPTWGRFKSITRPAIGNHEYRVSGSGTDCLSQGRGAPGYFTYFGSSIASPLDPGCTSSCKGYYSYDLGTWHLIALNSNCSQPGVGGCSSGSPQYNWLKNDLSLAGGMKNCILAYWHQPRYSSGGRQGSQTQPLWELLYDAGADIVLTGHDHVYERFGKLGRGTAAAVDPVADPNGIREWVVGVGGRNFTSWSTIRAQSQVRDNSAFGVLKLILHSNSYDWQFLPVAGDAFTDSGSSTCNGPVVADSPPSVPTGLTASAVSANEVDLGWNPSTDSDTTGVAGYHVFRNGAQIATVTSATSYKDPSLSPSTQYSYTVSAFDTANNESAQSGPAVATTPAVPTPPAVTTPPAKRHHRHWPKISGHPLKLRADGSVRIKLTCPADHPKRCKGTLRLTARHHRLGSRRFTLRVRHSALVKVHLTRSGQRLVRRAKRLTVRVGAGNSSRNLQLRA
jgi:acid phosphatase type 7